MKKTIDFHDFEQAFKDYNRASNFSYEGLKALWAMLEDYEDNCDEEIELDVIALCCEYTEYDSFKELTDSYDFIKYEGGGCRESLNYYAWYEKTESDGYIVHNF